MIKVEAMPTPTSKIGTAVITIVIHDGHVLMVSRPENPNQFGMPGGKVERGEKARDAAVREIYEEAGLKLPADSLEFLLQRIVPSRREPDTFYETWCYVARLDKVEELTSPEGLQIKWVEPWQIVQPPYAYFNSMTYQALCNEGHVKPQ